MTKTTNNRQSTGLEIAIVGMSCRFPGANNWREYWENLTNGRESIDFLSEEEIRERVGSSSLKDNQAFVGAVTTLPSKYHFDNAFFDYRPEEAALMNPLHRMLHECVWEALEDSGIDPERSNGQIGLYLGGGEDLHWRMYAKIKNINQEIDDFTLFNLNSRDFLPLLLSYKFNLKGPSVAVNTTCSTSLVAVHLACKSLLLGEARVALAGGVTVKTHKQNGYFHEEGMIFSKDGHCRAFDKDASGIVVSEGVGVVALKRLNDAIDDKDEIYAVIKGSAINNDGNRKVGFTAASVEGQAECIRKAHRFSRISPETISYVEAHGTGTTLGDPVELEALNLAFGQNSGHRCAIGSVKTNIGHTDAAAGVAGLIKTALSLKYKMLPASLHYKEANPNVNFNGGPFYVNTSLTPWTPTGDFPLRAGVSSFGIGGTNAHIILEEFQALPSLENEEEYQLLTLSAKTKKALTDYQPRLVDYLKNNPDAKPADIAYTYQTGRKQFPYRMALSFKDRDDLISKLTEKLQYTQMSDTKLKAKTVFMFPGQGSQYVNMGKDIYLREPLFRKEMDNGFGLLLSLTGEDYKNILYPEHNLSTEILDTKYAQPLIFVSEYALAKYLNQIGVHQDLMIGHSVGEYVAACLAGVFTFEDAIKIMIARGALMSAVERGAMVSVILEQGLEHHYLSDTISLAAVNGRNQFVYAGNFDAIAKLKERLTIDDIPFTTLHTSHAFHSSMFLPIVQRFSELLLTVKMNEPVIPYVSNLTGTFIDKLSVSTAQYWCDHLLKTVQFFKGLETLVNYSHGLQFIEVGAGNTLCTLLRNNFAETDAFLILNTIRSHKDASDDRLVLNQTVGRLWTTGTDIRWEHYHGSTKPRKVALPTYAFEKNIFPVEVDPFAPELMESLGLKAQHKSTDLTGALYFPSWKRAVFSEAPLVNETRHYLLFISRNSFGKSLSSSLKENGHLVIEVFPGETFKEITDGSYELNPRSAADFDQLKKKTTAGGSIFFHAIFAWPAIINEKPSAGNQLYRSSEVTYLSLCSLITVYAAGKSNCLQRITIISDALFKVTGGECGHPGQALILGLVNTIPQEFDILCQHVDLEISIDPESAASQLIKELGHLKSERVSGYRNGYKWLPLFEQNKSQKSHLPGPIKPKGVYIVTGGLGNVGFILSRHLIEKYNATVVLIGRSPVGDDTSAETNKSRSERFEILKKLNSGVLYLEADVAEQALLANAVALIEEKFERIDGVIHTAGVLDHSSFQLIEETDSDKVAGIFRPKVNGTIALFEVFKSRTPDFIWMTSSISSILGGISFSAYSSANAFMEQFALSVSNSGTHWKCLSLGEIDLQSEAKNEDVNAISPEQLTILFEWSLAIDDCPVVIATLSDLHNRISRAYEEKLKSDLSMEQTHEPSKQLDRSKLSTAFAHPETPTQEKLVTLFEAFFGTISIGIDDDFFELGGDSLKGMILLKRIKAELKYNLSLKDFMTNLSIRKLAERYEELSWLSSEGKEMTNEVVI